MATRWVEITHGLEYQIEGSVRVARHTNPCKLVTATITGVNSDEYMEIPCFACSSGFTDFDDYLHYYQRSLTSSIYWSNFPDYELPLDLAMKLASEFVGRLLPPANADHNYCSPFYFSPVYSLQIRFRDVSSSDDAYDTAVMESFEETVPTTKPTSLSYISELLRARGEKEKESSEWSCSDHDCCICMSHRMP